MPQTLVHFAAPALAAKAIGIGVLAARVRPKSARVYWAEDAADDQYLIKQVLPKAEGAARVDFFADGHALLAAVAKRKPDLVVLDLNMPGMDGITTLRHLRQQFTADALPVVIFSTARNEIEEQTCRSLGIADYFQKPAGYGGLDAVVAQILRFA